MDINQIYTQLIMEKSQDKTNKHHLENADESKRAYNASCGDDITLHIKYDGDYIADASFTGDGCAISQASTSMMVDLIKGKTKKEALKIAETFLAMIKKEITDEETLDILEDAVVLKNISNMPARVKCAVLCWHALSEMTT